MSSPVTVKILNVIPLQDLLGCLGATAAQTLLGRDFRITKRRGEIVAGDWCPRTLAAFLRMPDQGRRQEMNTQLISDLR